VVVYGKRQDPAEPNYLKTVNVFFEAYWKGWRSLSRLSSLGTASRSGNLQKINDQNSSDVCIYLGRANAKDVKDRIGTSPGVYVIFSHLDASLLVSMGLPPLPEPFRESPLVIQLKTTGRPLSERGSWNPWHVLAHQVAVEDKAEEQIERDTLNWRKEFMSEYECWTSNEVAKQSGSTAKNPSAMG